MKPINVSGDNEHIGGGTERKTLFGKCSFWKIYFLENPPFWKLFLSVAVVATVALKAQSDPKGF